MTTETRRTLFALVERASATLTASTLGRGRDSHGAPLRDLDRLEREALEALTEAGRIAEAALAGQESACVTTQPSRPV